MQEKELQKLQTTIKMLKHAFNGDEEYTPISDFKSALSSLKTALDDIRKSISETNSKFDNSLRSDLNTLDKEIKSLKKQIDVSSKTYANESNKILGSMKEEMDYFRSEITEKTSSLGIDSMEKRHNEMEIEMAKSSAEISAFNESIQSLKQELSNYIDSINTKITELSTSIKQSSRGGGSRRVFQPHVERFTSQTDGSRKTFYLARQPLKTDTIKVWGTDFPIILDPTVDFTVTGQALTLSDSVPAPSLGATLIVEYYA